MRKKGRLTNRIAYTERGGAVLIGGQIKIGRGGENQHRQIVSCRAEKGQGEKEEEQERPSLRGDYTNGMGSGKKKPKSRGKGFSLLKFCTPWRGGNKSMKRKGRDTA